MQRPRYFVFEGIDGSGKSTLSSYFTQALRYRVPDHVTVTRAQYPTKETPVGKLLRQSWVDKNLTERTRAYLFMADLVEYEQVIVAPLWQAGGYVVADRHPVISMTVYQSDAYPLHVLTAIQQRDQLISPDVTFLLDLPAQVVVERRLARESGRVIGHPQASVQEFSLSPDGEQVPVTPEPPNDLYERDVAHTQMLRERYLAYYIHHRSMCVMLDATAPADQLLAQCLQAAGFTS